MQMDMNNTSFSNQTRPYPAFMLRWHKVQCYAFSQSQHTNVLQFIVVFNYVRSLSNTPVPKGNHFVWAGPGGGAVVGENPITSLLRMKTCFRRVVPPPRKNSTFTRRRLPDRMHVGLVVQGPGQLASLVAHLIFCHCVFWVRSKRISF